MVTIEINPEHRNAAILNWIKDGFKIVAKPELGFDAVVAAKKGQPGGIISFLGDGPVVMRHLFESHMPSKPIAAYVDSHWLAKWPILDELQVLADFKLSDSVIIIHDAKNHDHPEFGFDNHGGVDLDMALVRGPLLKINPDYHIFHNSEAAGNMRGIIYATP